GPSLADYAATLATPFSWRYALEQAGGGALVDVGAPLLAAIQHVAGPVRRVLAAESRIVIPRRAAPARATVGHGHVEVTGEEREVTTDDVTALTAELDGGALVQLTISRVATGVSNALAFHVVGSEGSVAFDSLHPAELELFTRTVEAPERNGPRRVVVGPEQPSFATTIPMPARGVGSGYAAVFVGQAQDFLSAIVDGHAVQSDFWSGY